jgi:hypothetical protein
MFFEKGRDEHRTICQKLWPSLLLKHFWQLLFFLIPIGILIAAPVIAIHAWSNDATDK